MPKKDEEEPINAEQEEAEARDGFETSEVVADQQVDALLLDQLEKNLMQTESRLSQNRYTRQDLEFALVTLVTLKNYLIKYNPNKDRKDTEEIERTERVLDGFQEDPLRYIRAFNVYIMPILRSRYGSGLKYKRKLPWEKQVGESS